VTTTALPGEDTPPLARARRRVHVVADSDTRWKWGAAIASRIGRGDARDEVHGYLLRGRATPSDQQLADVGASVTTVRRMGIAETLDLLSAPGADVVVLACVGGTIHALMRGLAERWRNQPDRPVTITGYVGLVYERLVDGLLLRAGADVVLANSAADEAEFRSVFDAVGADPQSVIRTALPFMVGPPYDATAPGRSRPFTVCFATQPSVPGTRDERRYALTRAVAHAVRHPQRHVLIKLRNRPGEQTTHIERHHYSSVLAVPELPSNVEFCYGSMSDALDRTDLCVTVSSTAALEAMHRGIPSAVLTDFGIRESLGNHLFLRSGILASWAELDDGLVPVADRGWLAEHGVVDADPFRAAADRVDAFLRADRPPLTPWLTTARAPRYLQAVLARNGLDENGVPFLTAPGTARADRLRRVGHVAARGIYGVGVRRVEPVIRRWAQL
jgi:hypothetical protein